MYCFACCSRPRLSARAADTNSLVWHKAADRVDADIHGEAFGRCWNTSPKQTGWHIFVEPGTTRNASAKFKDLPSGDALRMLLGDLNFALVPQTNAPRMLYVFTHAHAKTPRSRCAVPSRCRSRHVANELLVKLKPGADIDALAKSLGAKIVGRMDKLGIYRLQFADAAATDAALAQLQGNSDVAAVDYNYYFDPPPSAQCRCLPRLSGVHFHLNLNPPERFRASPIVGLIDTNVQSLGSQLDKFILPQRFRRPVITTPNSYATFPRTARPWPTRFCGRLRSSRRTAAVPCRILPVDVYGAERDHDHLERRAGHPGGGG